MRKAQLFHNPGAGGGEHDIVELVFKIEARGFECHYSSVKEKGWDIIKEDTHFLIIAGGDGTVKKVCTVLLRHNIKLPIALLPLGTANNIASALKFTNREEEDIIQSWHNNKRIKYDTGKLTNAGNTQFFFESFGYGIFPFLIAKMTERKIKNIETPEQNKFNTLKILEQLIPSYKPADCHVVANGKDHYGKFFMAEIMVTKSIGPNLILAPYSSLDDGLFDLVLLKEKDKERFACHISDKINAKENHDNFTNMKAGQLTITWAGKDVHADDVVIELIPDSEAKVEIMPGALEFLVP